MALVLFLVSLVLMLLAPLFARLIWLAISRRREYLADASAARFTRWPEGLASALEKIDAAPEQLQRASRATAPMFTVNPLRRAGRATADPTSSHPPVRERVRILRAMGGASYADYDTAWRQVTGRRPVLPASARRESAPTPLRAPNASPATGAAVNVEAPAGSPARVRETGDLIWRLNGYSFVDCPCGATLKIPPGLVATRVACPGCGREHVAPPPPRAVA